MAACKEYEANRWCLDMATIPEDDNGLTEDDLYLTWTIRRFKRERRPDINVTTTQLSSVHERWDELRTLERWQFEKPLIATAKYFVKRVVI